MKNIGLSSIDNVRIGKHITLEVEAGSQAEAEEQVKLRARSCWPTRSWNSLSSVEAVEAVALSAKQPLREEQRKAPLEQASRERHKCGRTR